MLSEQNYTRTNQMGEGRGRKLRGTVRGVMGEEESIEDTWNEVLRTLGWSGQGGCGAPYEVLKRLA